MIKINDKLIIKNPIEFSVDVYDLDSGELTTRTANGELHRDRVAIKRKLNLRWSGLTWAILSKLLESVSAVFFEVTYPDPVSGKYETKTFYVGDRSSPVAFLKTDGTMLWEGLSMNFIEK